MNLTDRLNALHAATIAASPRNFKDYCKRADARLELCYELIAAWPRIARALGAT